MMQLKLTNFILKHAEFLDVQQIENIISSNVEAAISEDLGSEDITGTLISPDTKVTATLITRESAVLCGIPWAESVLMKVDPSIAVQWHASDGDLLTENQVIGVFSGCARSLLTAERTALNFLQTLSGTATQTHRYVELLKATHTRLLDTRKTLPGLRIAQKYAVYCGGGTNHRLGLFDAYLIKENHIAAAGSIALAIHKARLLQPDRFLEVEVETQHELEQAFAAGADRILCDNFNVEQLSKAVKYVEGKISLEASGGIDQESLFNIAQTGVDFISIGSLTKHVMAVDLSLRVSGF